MAQPLAETQRKEIFLALVDAQDQEMPVDVSRKVVAERFGVSEGQVRQIEREGLDNDWPPLGDGEANSG
jgi:Sigma-70, region 4